MKKITLLFLFFANLAFGQSLSDYPYEASAKHPFGLLNPEAPKQTADFTPLIGTSKCLSVNRNPDGTWQDTVKMFWTFKYIMNGMAVQDETLKADGKYSGSIRQYNTDSAKWIVTYYTSVYPSADLPEWTGNMEDGKIILYRDQKAPNGYDGFSRLTFFNISEKSFRWIGEWVDVNQTIVYPIWTIDCKKKVASNDL